MEGCDFRQTHFLLGMPTCLKHEESQRELCMHQLVQRLPIAGEMPVEPVNREIPLAAARSERR